MAIPSLRGIIAVLVTLAFVHDSVAAIWNFGRTTNQATETDKDSQESVSYGVDISFPMQHDKVSDNYAWLSHNVQPGSESTPRRYKDMPIQPLGERQKFYDDFMKSCTEAFGKKDGRRCISNEKDRIAMSLRQPQSMQNYTEVGFKKIRAPEGVFKLIKQFWNINKDQKKMENWGTGNTYTNNWQVPSYMVSLEDSGLRGGGASLKRQIWDSARKTIEDWTGESLTECSLYGIRIYEEGAVLATHVDRLPLVSSAIINVDQDVDEPWPLEVIGHDGKAYNVTMEPGDMVLYESHSILHGRPFPLKGRFMANVFIHFEPTGHSLRHNAENEAEDKHVDEKYREATARGAGGHEVDVGTGLPPYIKPGTPEEARWRRSHPDGKLTNQKTFTTGSKLPEVNQAAQSGDLNKLTELVGQDKSAVHTKDRNGWTPLHEAARGGHDKVAKYLLENGANANEKANHGTPLHVANKFAGKNHPVTLYLESIGALNLGPEL